ncbi:cysteine--tRNA ligase [Candidatus Saccharibacteria bacterium]|nr:cysteine--tRNA ligase [Candidatus Saccharibacteria bacterium]
MIKLHNTLTRSIDTFTPIDSKKVSLYTCGPTVYDHLHVGNWAAYIYWDILVRTLLAHGYHVERVMNITDVGHLVSDADEGEDKLEKGASREGKSAWDIAEYYAEDFMQGMELLGMIPPEHVVRATEFIPQQLDLIRLLKEKGYTYQTDDGIYFDTSKFPRYANFAHLDLEAQKAGARVEQNTSKRQPWDFAIWKFTPKDKTRDMQWATPADLLDSPLNEGQEVMGFPGWHLECSAIAMSILGPTIDLHTGGIDHIPVHHTNEIAQSEAASEQPFAHYWLHNNHIKIDGGKVSKSLGNGYTLQDISARGYLAMDLRMFVLQGQFTNEGNFTFDNLAAAHNRLANWKNYAALRHQTHDSLNDDDEKSDKDMYVSLIAGGSAIREALGNNLNTPEALRVVDESFARLDGVPLNKIHRHGLLEFLEDIDELLGLQLIATTPDINDDAKRLMIERARARDSKDWSASDSLREKLLEDHRIIVNDTPSGVTWSYALYKTV